MAKRKQRKQSESPPPSKWCRSSGGVPFMLKRTNQINDADEWLYKADFGNIIGTGKWSLTDLAKDGVTYLEDQPDDWELAEHRTRPTIIDEWK